MSIAMPVAVLHVRFVRMGLTGGSILGSGLSAGEIGGLGIGLLTALLAAGGLALQNAANQRAIKREREQDERDREQELLAAEMRGEKRMADQLRPLITQAHADTAQARREIEFWRGLHFVANPNTPMPKPPEDKP